MSCGKGEYKTVKKILSILIAITMVVSLSGCFGLLETESGNKNDTPTNKTYYVNDTQKMDNVSLKVTSVESGNTYGTERSKNGQWVLVYFTMENLSDEPYRISYLYFTLNDTYTIRETTYRLTNIESGGFYLIKGTIYEFWCVYDCKYGHNEKDIKFIWESNDLFKDTREWVL
jgi:hypothetical protein